MATILGLTALAAFAFALLWQLRLKKGIEQCERRIALAETLIAQLSLDWSSIPAYTGPGDPLHPYANDLNIIGERSLIQLLDHSVTESGHEKLRRLLLAPATSVEEVKKRQQIVYQLSRRRVFQKKLFTHRGNQRIDDERITRTFQTSAMPRSAATAAWVLGAIAVLNGTAFFALGIRSTAFLFGYGIYLLSYLAYYTRADLGPVFARAINVEYELNRIRDLFSVLERRSGHCAPELSDTCSLFRDRRNTPSVVLKRLSREVAFLGVRASPLVHITLNLLLPWDLLFAVRYQSALTAVRNAWPSWIGQLATIEAYACLANFSHYRPRFCWPLLDGSRVFLEARAIGHPLIPEEERVTNDIKLESRHRIGVVTGSNMSGKSAFLRTIGINACLANAGSAVCAEAYASSLMSVHCSISVSDSLADGVSFFYAEILRLKTILAAAQDRANPGTVLALIDEIFRGTNNRERIIGSLSYLQETSRNDCLGLVSTHDLEVARFCENAGRFANYHFGEFVKEGQLRFDYKLRPGISQTTNALMIMRMAGLPVSEEITGGDETSSSNESTCQMSILKK